MAQLPFRWPLQTSYAPADFIIGSANEHAVQFLQSWRGEESNVALLVGPAMSGKTHLALSWAAQMQAGILDRTLLGTAPSPELWRSMQAAVLEDIHLITDEVALFHMIRYAETQRLALLLTSRMQASEIAVGLPDLHSRLMALPEATIFPPDEALLHAFLTKRFADRQWHVSEEVTTYMLKRMERSFAAAEALMERMDLRISETNHEITIPALKGLL